MAKAPHQDSTSVTNPWDGFTAWTGPMMAAVGQAVQNCADACAEWQQEIARFSGARFDEDRRAQAALTSCRNFGDIMKIQQDWGAKAARDYFDETTRLVQVATKFAQAGMAPFHAAEKSVTEHGLQRAAE